MHFGVKLSVILTLDPFRFFLLEKTFFLTLLYLLSFTIIGLGLFWPAFCFPSLCVRSRSAGEISVFIFVDIVSITKSSVTCDLIIFYLGRKKLQNYIHHSPPTKSSSPKYQFSLWPCNLFCKIPCFYFWSLLWGNKWFNISCLQFIIDAFRNVFIIQCDHMFDYCVQWYFCLYHIFFNNYSLFTCRNKQPEDRSFIFNIFISSYTNDVLRCCVQMLF